MSQAAQVVILIAFLALVGAEVVDIDSSCSPAIQGETDESLNLVQLRASKDSLQDTANSTSLYSMFDAMDENRDHQVSLEEAWQHLDQESWSKVTDVFGKIDADHDGIISSSDLQKRAGKNGENAAELNSILTKKGGPPPPPPPPPPPANCVFPSQSLPPGGTYGNCVPGSTLNHGHTCQLQCSGGYELSGQGNAGCDNGHVWVNMVQCATDSAWPYSCSVELYQHGYFTGWKATFTPGDFDYSQMRHHQGFQNDDASSIKVIGENCVAEVYQHEHFQGVKAVYAPGEYDYDLFMAGGAPNDAISSMKVVHSDCVAIGYEHAGFEGWAAVFPTGEFDYPEFVAHGAGNDEISSIKVLGSHCQAKVYQHQFFGGWEVVFPEGASDYNQWIGVGAVNDDASAIKVVAPVQATTGYIRSEFPADTFCQGGAKITNNGGPEQNFPGSESIESCAEVCNSQQPFEDGRHCEFFLYKDEPGHTNRYRCATFAHCDSPHSWNGPDSSHIYRRIATP